MGTNCAPLLVELFLYSYEAKFISPALNGKETVSSSVKFCIQPRIRKLSGPDVSYWTWDQEHNREHHFCFLPRFTIVDLEWLSTSHFYLRQTRWFKFQLHTSIYDKRDDLNFNITNFPFLSSYMPSVSFYDVFISQLIRYAARACFSYKWLILRARQLSSKLIKQGYILERLKSSFRKFYGRYGDLIQQYEFSLSRMLNDILIFDQLQLHPHQSDFPPLS